MLSLVVLIALLAAVLFFYKKSKNLRWLTLALFVFSALIIETVIYGYFIFLIAKGSCFLLIGNQKMLDALIQARLTHSIYFAQGKPSFFYHVDPVLGYTVGRDKNAGSYVSNNSGMRDTKNYPLLPNKDQLRLAVFGDSFVFWMGRKMKTAGQRSWPAPFPDWKC